MSQILAKSGVLEVCLPIAAGLGLLFAVLINVNFPPSDIRDYQDPARVEMSLTEV